MPDETTTEESTGNKESTETTSTDQDQSGKEDQESTPRTEESTKEGETKTEPEKDAKTAPENYTLKLPKNASLDSGHLKELEAYAKEQGLSQKQAQAMVENQDKLIRDYTKGQAAELEAKTEKWLTDIKEDKEIGGDNFNENIEISKRVLDRFATPEFTETLNATGLGNHPELVRVFTRIGKSMSEDQLVRAGDQSGGKEKSAEQIMYPGA